MSSAEPERTGPERALAPVALVDLLDRLLGAGVVLSGDLVISLAGVDLVQIRLHALIASVRKEMWTASSHNALDGTTSLDKTGLHNTSLGSSGTQGNSALKSSGTVGNSALDSSATVGNSALNSSSLSASATSASSTGSDSSGSSASSQSQESEEETPRMEDIEADTTGTGIRMQGVRARGATAHGKKGRPDKREKRIP